MLKQLKYFQSVVRLGSFSAAAGGKFHLAVSHLPAGAVLGA